MDDTSRLIRDRNRILTAMASIFVLWQGTLMVRDIFRAWQFDGAEQVAALAETGETIGLVLWLIATIFLLVFMRRVKRAEAQNIINDEYFGQVQAQAMRIGFKALIAALAVALGVEAFVELEAELVIRFFMIVAVAAPLGAFVILSSGGEGEE